MAADPRGQKNRGPRQVAHRDPLQNARNPDACQIIVRKASQQQPKQEDQRGPPQHMQEQSAPVRAFLHTAREAERHRHPDNPQEKRKHRVRESPPIPLRVQQWWIYIVPVARIIDQQHRGNGCAAESIQRYQAGAGLRGRQADTIPEVRDIHSYARPERKRVRHLELQLRVDFDSKRLEGAARVHAEGVGEALVLDTRGLDIRGVTRPWRLGPADPLLGAPLEIEVGPGGTEVTIEYTTAPDAGALQWLDDGPCLFTQSQAIHARSWAPVQDTPGVRATWSARVDAPAGLRVLTSSGSLPVPAYLMALAVGRFEFAPLSARCGVWAAGRLLRQAAREFEDIERMMEAAESLYGPYRWGRYDILVLPPSFPFGGMENPCLTFATPTILAGDKSLVSLVAHELAHSWSGNLVTNATWRDFWLNEGFTTYVERRIQEVVFGARRASMEAAVEMAELRAEMARLPDPDQRLALDLDGRDPDDGCTLVPYVKGAALLRRLEQVHGRALFDRFLRGYIDRFAFQSITTEQFVEYYEKELGGYDLRPWLHQPGLPADLPEPDFVFETEPREGWATQEWLHWIRSLPPASDLASLDARWGLTQSSNSEICCAWLRVAIERGYGPASDRVREFLCSVGRRKFLKPLYQALGRERGRPIFELAKANYHPIACAEIAKILDS